MFPKRCLTYQSFKALSKRSQHLTFGVNQFVLLLFQSNVVLGTAWGEIRIDYKIFMPILWNFKCLKVVFLNRFQLFLFSGRPDSVSDCVQFNHSTDSIHIKCVQGFDGGLTQLFTLEIRWLFPFKCVTQNFANLTWSNLTRIYLIPLHDPHSHFFINKNFVMKDKFQTKIFLNNEDFFLHLKEHFKMTCF